MRRKSACLLAILVVLFAQSGCAMIVGTIDTSRHLIHADPWYLFPVAVPLGAVLSPFLALFGGVNHDKIILYHGDWENYWRNFPYIFLPWTHVITSNRRSTTYCCVFVPKTSESRK